MENLFYSLGVTMPVFLVMVLGNILGRTGFLTKEFCKIADKLVFRVALPCLLFLDLVQIDLKSNFDAFFVLFCAGATLISIIFLFIGAKFFLPRKEIGEFVQASYRSSAAILGTVFIVNMYGNSGMAPLMIIGSVPLFNIFAVLLLLYSNEDDKKSSAPLKKAFWGIVTNPIIIGIVLGVVFALLPVTLPKILTKTMSNVANLSSPLALLSIGASFEFKKVMGKMRQALTASFFKLVGLACIFMPLAIFLGFREQKLIAILIMLCSPTTPTCYIMAKNMGSDGVTSSGTIALTTLLSSFTLTAWIFILKSAGLV